MNSQIRTISQMIFAAVVTNYSVVHSYELDCPMIENKFWISSPYNALKGLSDGTNRTMANSQLTPNRMVVTLQVSIVGRMVGSVEIYQLLDQ